MATTLRQGARSGVLVAMVAMGGGCGLFEDADKVTASSDWLAYGVDADAFGINVPEGGALPDVDCSSNAQVCEQLGQLSCSGAQYACHIDCGEDGACQVRGVAEDGELVDISGKVSRDQLSKVTLKGVECEVTANTLNFATPAIDLSVGPEAAADATSAGVVFLGRLDPIAPGITFPPRELPLEGAGVEALSRLARESGGKLKIFARGEIVFPGGHELPAGKLDFRLRALFQVDVL